MRKVRFYQKAGWRWSLLVGMLLVIVASMYFTQKIAKELRKSERERVELWAEATRQLAFVEDASLHLEVISKNKTIPVLLVDKDDQIIDAINFEKELKDNLDYFEAELQDLKTVQKPIIIKEEGLYENHVYYKSSNLILLLEYLPYGQFLILAVFLMLAYWTIIITRKAEQERVWVGMAKETAHQLGTPITSLVGWIDNMKLMYDDNDDILMIAEEIEKDVELLETVAERFSKIGAVPELKPTNIFDNLQRHYAYVKQRAPRKVSFDFPAEDVTPTIVHINSTLFNWVVENLLRNALDAMGGKGKISAVVSEDKKYVNIDISDTGKGIPKANFKSVFKPGFSTKKRGWGLGLSLCKRIVETYHKGRIFVKESNEEKGTTFRIQLPKDIQK